MSKLSELLAAARKQKELSANPPSVTTPIAAAIIPSHEVVSVVHHGIGKNGEAIEYNTQQWNFIQTVLGGKSCVLIGAAGTGKTTSTRGAISELLRTKHIPPIADSHKHLPSDSPAIVFVSYTRRAVMNLKKAVPSE
jgi:hypothetical protein